MPRKTVHVVRGRCSEEDEPNVAPVAAATMTNVSVVSARARVGRQGPDDQ